ncbi:MAG: S8 family serine peptidase [Proteobacteria bacterium]|nr:S8 family serine peptidase [Pseudomonadota bacterium]
MPVRLLRLTLPLLLTLTACAAQHGVALPAAGPGGDGAQWLVITVRNVAQPQALHAGSGPRGYDTVSSYGLTSAAASQSGSLARDFGLIQVSAWPMENLPVHCILFRASAPLRDATLTRLRHDPRVESLEPLNEFRTQAQQRPAPAGRAAWMPYNDPYGRLQYALHDLSVIEAQQHSRGAGVRIALIDTGVDLGHPDLQGRIAAHRNFVDADERAFRADLHGTQMAGVIAAVADNGIGIVGVAPEARLLVYKACWQRAGSTTSVCNSYTLAQALDAAISARADVVNLSLAGPPDPLLARLIQVGVKQGMIFVAAIPPGQSGGFPADEDGVLAVAAAEDPGGHGVAAPARDILTLTPGGHYDFASGSSLATAEVTGIAALLLAVRHHLTAVQLRRALQLSSESVTGVTTNTPTVNASAALDWVMSGVQSARH